MLNRLALERHAAFIVRRLHTRRRGDIQREHRGRDDAADRMLAAGAGESPMAIGVHPISIRHR
jgi:hypothetical protein